MNIKRTDYGLVFACGVSINEYIKEIPILIDKYVSIGVNRFPNKFAEKYQSDVKSMPVDYWIFSDSGAKDFIVPYYNNQKLVVCKNLHEDFKLLEENNIPIYYPYSMVCGVQLVDHGYLYGYGSTTLQAVDFLLLHGIKNIVLFGMDDRTNEQGNWEHFYSSGFITKGDNQIRQISNELEEYKKCVKLYKASSYSNLNLEVIDVKNLLKGQ